MKKTQLQELSFWHKLEHGFKKVGHDIGKVAEKAEHGTVYVAEKAEKAVAHEAKKAGIKIEHGVVHFAKGLPHDLKWAR